jgi:hypothetical protein
METIKTIFIPEPDPEEPTEEELEQTRIYGLLAIDEDLCDKQRAKDWKEGKGELPF